MADIEKQVSLPVSRATSDESGSGGPSGNGAAGGYFAGPALQHTISHDTQRAFPVYHRKLGNPAPLGLISFAATTLMLSLYNIQTRHITVPNVVVGMAFGVGGLTQLLAGMWEFGAGNTFGATAFSAYGGFWFSYGIILYPGSGVLDAYNGDKSNQLNDALGIFLLVWFIITFIMFFGTFRASVSLAALFFFLDLTFLLLMIGEFMQKTQVTQAGGVIGAITAFIAFYTGAAGLYSPDASYFILPVGDLPKRKEA
ncbi:Ammonia transport outward protein 2 OS=Saccharomyces cerevisiae (strain ATCC 204508 / S288c) GN=ATO2 PE=1 SV=1 [Rhizoctonia solani AG-1 IB]|uniref:Ammonia transport outward protein 2 n=2 Tax=Rhizoctonia solani TaxID=456999 RepID=M5C2W8_THACB|nr:unnamed protein product [Rhizoctonia solani]CCO33375.1 hypothetical protein BN14_07450 [Rhizoctonia solani AG-1 IB]CEL59975.1 Ammonia transport outward protein 2 OS=Saccharomyces cerevisiae (strain ATCC 204508 / S288c) GN=ATO2 PE=1 SV=1 [Rhizoctonia solani AG-1 IB]